MSGGLESNFDELAQAIFSQPSRPPGTIQLGLEECAPPDATEEKQNQILFEILIGILIEGIKVKYGKDVDFASLTAAQIGELSKYALSYGFSTHIRTDSLTEPPPVSQEPLKELKDFSERYYDYEREVWHELYFDWANLKITGSY
jgi:hypothetical protein